MSLSLALPSQQAAADDKTVLRARYHMTASRAKEPGAAEVQEWLPSKTDYFVSLCAVCLRQRLQNFENSSRPVVVFLFFVVE
jgi:hypothetical protein